MHEQTRTTYNVYTHRGVETSRAKTQTKGVGEEEVRFVILWSTPGGTHDVQFDIPGETREDHWKIDRVRGDLIVDGLDARNVEIWHSGKICRRFYCVAAPSLFCFCEEYLVYYIIHRLVFD